MSDKKIWDYRITKNGKVETLKAYNYFQEFLMLGRERTLQKAAEVVGKSCRNIEMLSSRWDWIERANAYDDYVLRRQREAFEVATVKRYELANDVASLSLEFFKTLLKEIPSVKLDELSVKDVKAAVDAAAKLIKRESAVELDTSNGKFTNLSGEEIGDIFLASINKASGGYEKEEEKHVNGENRE